jgi:hypothetical protein
MWKPEHRRAADRYGLRYPSDLSDSEWALIEPAIPPAKHGGRRREVNVREVLNAIFYVLSTGCQWTSRYARPALAPRIRFLFIGSHLCSTLPSDPASRRQPLRFTNPSPPSGWVEDFHLRAIEHARHTTNPLTREWSERLEEGLPSERIVGVEAQPLKTGAPRWPR